MKNKLLLFLFLVSQSALPSKIAKAMRAVVPLAYGLYNLSSFQINCEHQERKFNEVYKNSVPAPDIVSLTIPAYMQEKFANVSVKLDIRVASLNGNKVFQSFKFNPKTATYALVLDENSVRFQPDFKSEPLSVEQKALLFKYFMMNLTFEDANDIALALSYIKNDWNGSQNKLNACLRAFQGGVGLLHALKFNCLAPCKNFPARFLYSMTAYAGQQLFLFYATKYLIDKSSKIYQDFLCKKSISDTESLMSDAQLFIQELREAKNQLN